MTKKSKRKSHGLTIKIESPSAGCLLHHIIMEILSNLALTPEKKVVPRCLVHHS